MSRSGLDAVRELAGHYAAVAASLTPAEWGLPSRCAGWSVLDLVAHTGSNFRVLVEPPPAPSEQPPPLTAEQGQDLLVQARRGWSAAEVLAEFQLYRATARSTSSARCSRSRSPRRR